METCKKRFLFNYTECDALKEYLEFMALKGWILKSITPFSLIFKKNEPQNLKYSVEVFENASIFDTRLENRAKEYIEYCSYAGWEFVCNIEKIHIFVSFEENPVPIQTDEKIKFQTIKKSMLKKNILGWFVLPLLFAFNIIFPWINSFSFAVTNYIFLLTIILYIMYFVKVFSEVTNFCIWCFKARKNLSEDKKLHFYSQKDLMRRSNIRKIPLIISFSLLIFLIIYSFIEKHNENVIISILIIFLAFLNLGIPLCLNKWKMGKHENITFQLVAGFLVAIIAFGFSGIIIAGFPDNQMTKENVLKENNIPITIEDILIEFPYMRHTNISIDRTFLAEHVSFYEFFSEISEVQGISYEIFSSRFKFIIDQYLRFVMRYQKELYEKADPSKWGAKTVYTRKNDKEVFAIVVYDEHVFMYKGYEPLYDNTINKIRENLLKYFDDASEIKE